ncbi:NADP-dependent oxidoreductase [Pigmentiphaga soli]|uniref:NADP-dependent oxidoreductase n=1 Tax=Pigmentiphaga soli TaxID=1007095 RepID=A0ABP8GXP7_9BURK
MDTMRAVRIHHFGGLEALQPENVAIPSPAAGEVRVKVFAAGLNPVDYKTRAGKYPLVREDKLPYTLGRDFAGRVDTPAGDGLEVGDAVYGFVGQGQGAFAEYVVVGRDALAPKPASLDFRTAAAVPLAALTAWQGLFDHGGVLAGQRVLIHAASGGVGHFAVQLARAEGAEVIATASGDGVEFVRSLGADRVIDYRHEAFEQIVRDVDMVFDLVGGDTQARSWQVLKEGGALVSTIQAPSQELAAERGIRATRYTARPDGGQLTEIGGLIDCGMVKVRVAAAFHFRDAVEAERRLEQGHLRGKLVLEVAPS